MANDEDPKEYSSLHIDLTRLRQLHEDLKSSLQQAEDLQSQNAALRRENLKLRARILEMEQRLCALTRDFIYEDD